MKDEIIIAGHGGQGVVLAGTIISGAAMRHGFYTSGMMSYGVEMRGGTANSTVVFSDKPIGSPVVVHPTTAIYFNQASIDKFEERMVDGGIVLMESNFCKKVSREDLKVYCIPAVKMAEELGEKRVLNMIMVGALFKVKKMNLEFAKEALSDKFKGSILDINVKALQWGYDNVR